MAAVPTTCTTCGRPVLRVLVAGTHGGDKTVRVIDPTPGGPRPRIDLHDEQWIGNHQRGSWPRELHTMHAFTCGKDPDA